MLGKSCGGASTQLAPGAVGNSVSRSGTLAAGPPTPAIDWFEVTFATGPARQNINYHPKITLTGAGAGIVFDVTTDCNGSVLSCADASGAGLTQTWEQSYTQPNLDLAKLTWGVGAPVAAPADGIVYVRVYRASGTPKTCADDSFTITASN